VPGHRRLGRIRTINRQGSFIGEEDQLRGRAEVRSRGRKGDIIALSRMMRPVENSERIMARPMVPTKVERGSSQASTTGLEVKRRVATIERRKRNHKVVNSIRTKIQMLRSRELIMLFLASMGSLEKNGIYQVLLHGEVS